MRTSDLVAGALRGLQEGTTTARVLAATGDLTAKTFVRPLGNLARLSISAGVAITQAAARTPPLKQALRVPLTTMSAALSILPGVRRSELSADELREFFVTSATESGGAMARETVAFVESMTRALLGDTTGLRRQIEEAVERMRFLSEAGGALDGLPIDPLPEDLRDRARLVLSHAPHRLLTALENGSSGQSAHTADVLKAMLEDADNLQIFTRGYLEVTGRIGAKIAKLLLTDTLTLADLDAFLAGRRFEVPRSSTRSG